MSEERKLKPDIFSHTLKKYISSWDTSGIEQQLNCWKNSSTMRSMMQKEIKQRRNQFEGLFFNILQVKMKKRERKHKDQEIQPIEEAEEQVAKLQN